MSQQLVQLVHRRVFNCYLVREHDGLTLVDTGPAGALPAIRAQVDRLAAPLRRVLLTHAHGDHLGGLDELAAADSELEVIVGRREAALLAGDFTLRPGEPAPAPKQRNYGRPKTQPTRLVDDGDRVGSLRVIATPGHTPGHLSVIDTRDRTLISGDALTTIGHVAISGELVWRWPFPARSTWNKQLAASGAQRLHDEQPVRLATGHGPVVAMQPKRSLEPSSGPESERASTHQGEPMRLSAILAACASLAILAVAATASADQQPTVTGGCHVDVNAQVKPGLTLASHPFQFAYQGQLSSCYYTGTGAAHGGAISAGRQITIDGRRYQEPVPTGSGSCLVTSAAGYDFAFWNNGTQTIVKYQTTSLAGVTHLTGMVWPGLTLPAVDPKPGDPKSITFKTTNFNGQTVFGVMQFTADPRLCNTSQGVEAATISGQLGHYGPQTSSTAPDLNCSTTTQGEVCTTQRYTAPVPARPAAKPGRRRCSTKNRSQRTPQRCTARRHKQNRGTHGQGAAQPTSSSAAPMGLTSSAFANGGSLPRRYTCLGKLISPPLAWTNVPARTRELELLVTDAARNNLSHWVLYAIPPADTGAAEAAAPPGAKQGTNGFGLQGYLPPCPFVGLDPHKYVFELFASRKPLNLPGQPTDPQVRAALEGNTLATATLTATYKFGD